jgi:hypothetical protein
LHRKIAVFSVILLALTGCKNEDRLHVETNEGAPRLASMLAMSDPKAPTQLLDGWYGLEDKAWRWTSGHFAVLLRPPTGSAQSGATLKLQFSIPQALIDRVKTTSITATIKGTPLPPETYTQAGSFTFTRDVAAGLLAEETVKVLFSLDKFIPAHTVENRELGLIVTAVGLEPKTAAAK